ncbi:ATP-binding protein [Actinotalea fermentans]|nr:ATP-binding protein [Actinotalea fermentans]KGM15103.1 histidine kinase [Actinotalea fermentans ATCC 43279 = JCM 9966 = DSM 3133]
MLLVEPRLPLRRPPQGRVVGGVCRGLSLHLRVPVGVVRLSFVLLTLAGGTGVLLYLWFWVTVPVGDPSVVAAEARPPSLSRLAPRLRQQGRTLPVGEIAIGLMLIAGAVLLIAVRNGAEIGSSWVLPALIALAGIALAWSQLDAIQRDRRNGAAVGRMPISVLRLVGGTVLVGLAVFLVVGQEQPMEALIRSAVAAVAVLIGSALVLAPWWLRLVRELGDERAARARESERADIAAHLHDGVLQTLALIRRQATDAEEVARLARAQERELREWLYDDRRTPGTSIASDLRGVVAEVEDTRAVAVDVVVVGDAVPDAGTDALLQATREALVNAVSHGKAPYSLYLEVTDAQVEVFVRDHGEGFDLDTVPTDRFGVRESIIGRVTRRGGTATVQSRPGRGTEVHLCLPRENHV